MTTEVFNKEHKKVGTIDLPDRVFGAKWNQALVHQVVVSYAANERNEIAHTKDRSEVRGGGKKPWRQKHTGRARHGSSRSPIWVGGGVTFGPRKERDFSKKINKKMKRAALYSILSKKFTDKEIFVVDDLTFENHKTKSVAAFLDKFFNKKQSVLIVPDKKNKDIFLAARNVQKVNVTLPNLLNAYVCAKYKQMIFEKNAVENILSSTF